jgi:hypothetical protein
MCVCVCVCVCVRVCVCVFARACVCVGKEINSIVMGCICVCGECARAREFCQCVRVFAYRGITSPPPPTANAYMYINVHV